MTRRRAKGTGSVTLHRASGRWLWRLAGRSGYEATREEAERVLEVLREEIEQAGPMTLLDWLDTWLDRRETRGRVRYVGRDRARVDAYVRPYEPFGVRALTRLTRRDCVLWVRWLEERPSRRGGRLAKNTIRNAKALVHRALEDAIDEGILAANPLHGVRVVGGAPKRAHDWLRPDEVDAVLGLDLDPRQRAIISVAIYAGLSPLELWHLEWAHVDLRGRMLHVRGAVKRASRVRDVPLIRETVPALRAWRREQAAERERAAAAGRVLRMTPLVFPARSGRPHRPSADPARWRARTQRRGGRTYRRPSIPEQAGIGRHLVFRDLRHTFASNLVSGSWGPAVDLHRLAYLMGHSDTAATQIYAHLHPDGPIAAMRALDSEGP